jgi:hypothetical protein
MKGIPFLRRPITHNFKRPHSKAEKPDPAAAGFLWYLPSLMIMTQFPRGEGFFIKNPHRNPSPLTGEVGTTRNRGEGGGENIF